MRLTGQLLAAARWWQGFCPAGPGRAALRCQGVGQDPEEEPTQGVRVQGILRASSGHPQGILRAASGQPQAGQRSQGSCLKDRHRPAGHIASALLKAPFLGRIAPSTLHPPLQTLDGGPEEPTLRLGELDGRVGVQAVQKGLLPGEVRLPHQALNSMQGQLQVGQGCLHVALERTHRIPSVQVSYQGCRGARESRHHVGPVQEVVCEELLQGECGEPWEEAGGGLGRGLGQGLGL